MGAGKGRSPFHRRCCHPEVSPGDGLRLLSPLPSGEENLSSVFCQLRGGFVPLLIRAVARESANQFHMGHHRIVVRKWGGTTAAGALTSALHDFPVPLPCEDVVNAIVLLSIPLNVREIPFFGVLKNVFTRARPWLEGQRSNKSLTIVVTSVPSVGTEHSTVFTPETPSSSPSHACIEINQYKQLFMLGHLFYGHVKCCPE